MWWYLLPWINAVFCQNKIVQCSVFWQKQVGLIIGNHHVHSYFIMTHFCGGHCICICDYLICGSSWIWYANIVFGMSYSAGSGKKYNLKIRRGKKHFKVTFLNIVVLQYCLTVYWKINWKPLPLSQFLFYACLNSIIEMNQSFSTFS